MTITRIDLFHLRIPCKNAFNHAKSSRSESEVILVKLSTKKGLCGWGEMLPRDYVTGETIESIMQIDDASVSASLLGQKVADYDGLSRFVMPLLKSNPDDLSQIGGLELALWDLVGKQSKAPLDKIFGPVRSEPTGHCFTVGHDCVPGKVRPLFIAAKMQNATTIKLKIGSDIDRDVECIEKLIELCGNSIALRLDGNGAYSFEDANTLLSKVDPKRIQSFEEPVELDHVDIQRQLHELHKKHGVALLADEAVCSIEDAENLIQKGLYQWFNIRVGKHGGLLASCEIRDKALEAGVKLVGGSMVGETSVLTQASSMLLKRSRSISYVEGLGQNKSWLLSDPFSGDNIDFECSNRLAIDDEILDKCLLRKITIE